MDWIEEKRRLIKILLNITNKRKVQALNCYKDTQDRANEAEGAMQSRYDTFKEEGQYLAGGLKIQYDKLDSAASIIESILKEVKVKESKKVQLYSIAYLDYDEGEKSKFFVFPVMGGEKIDEEINIISPSSPIGKALIGKEEGGEFEFIINGNSKTGEITFVV
jgi:transcription elongation GreA/GreB family factor